MQTLDDYVQKLLHDFVTSTEVSRQRNNYNSREGSRYESSNDSEDEDKLRNRLSNQKDPRLIINQQTPHRRKIFHETSGAKLKEIGRTAEIGTHARNSLNKPENSSAYLKTTTATNADKVIHRVRRALELTVQPSDLLRDAHEIHEEMQAI